jgi:internalin A
MSDLDRILQGRPSRQAWTTLLRLLDPWPVGVELAAVERALAHWPAAVRAAPGDAWRAARDGHPPPWWALVRHVDLEPSDEPTSLEPLRRVTSLAFSPDDEAFPAGWLAELDQLEVLGLSGVKGLTSFTELPELPALHTVRASGCAYLEDLCGLDAQPALRSLVLSASFDGLALDTLPELPGLRLLHLDRTRSIDDLAPLRRLPGLETLKLSECTRVTDLAPLAACRALTWLDLSRIPGIRDAGPLGALAQLDTLWLDGDVLAALAPIAALPIRELILGHAARADAASVSVLGRLETLHLVDIADVDLDALATSPVERLFLVRCAHLGELAALARFARVHQLILDALPELRDLDAIGAMPALVELQVGGCRSLRDVSGLAAARKLDLVALRDCPGVTDVSALAGLPALRHIDVSGSPVTRGLELLDAQRTGRG